MDQETRNPVLHKLAEQLESVKRHARSTTQDLTPDQLGWQPAPTAWGVGHCLEHLILTHEPYEPVIPHLMAEGRQRGGPSVYGGWKTGWAGGFILKSVTPGSRPVPTFAVFKPLKVRPDPLGAFLQKEDQLAGWLREADGLDLNRIRLSSPALRLLRYNLGTAFQILVVHAERHLQQADRVKSAPGFPLR